MYKCKYVCVCVSLWKLAPVDVNVKRDGAKDIIRDSLYLCKLKEFLMEFPATKLDSTRIV